MFPGTSVRGCSRISKKGWVSAALILVESIDKMRVHLVSQLVLCMRLHADVIYTHVWHAELYTRPITKGWFSDMLENSVRESESFDVTACKSLDEKVGPSPSDWQSEKFSLCI